LRADSQFLDEELGQHSEFRGFVPEIGDVITKKMLPILVAAQLSLDIL